MKSVINLYSKKAKNDLMVFKGKKYDMNVRIENVHLKDINKLMGFDLFSKNDLYVGGETLWSVMQPKGSDEHHNHHNLTPEDVLEALKSIKRPYCVLENGYNKVSIVASIVSHLGVPLNIIIEIGDGIRGDSDANINKLVTLFPIGRIEEHIKSVGIEKVYYLNTGNKAK